MSFPALLLLLAVIAFVLAAVNLRVRALSINWLAVGLALFAGALFVARVF